MSYSTHKTWWKVEIHSNTNLGKNILNIQYSNNGLGIRHVLSYTSTSAQPAFMYKQNLSLTTFQPTPTPQKTPDKYCIPQDENSRKGEISVSETVLLHSTTEFASAQT